MDVRPLLAQRRAPPRDGTNLWRAFGAVALLQCVGDGTSAWYQYGGTSIAVA